MHRLLAAVAAALLTALPLLFVSPSAAEVHTVVIDASGVHPAELAVPAGASVTFRNTDGDRHRLRADADGARFDTGDIEPGESVTVPFSTSGTYSYVDERTEDGRFSGRVVVGTSAPPSSGGGTPAPQGGNAAPVVAAVAIGDRVFSPADVRIGVGGSVTWTNNDDRAHTATSNEGTFDSGTVGSGGRFTQQFASAGTFPYRCDLHPDMTGTVVVAPSDGSPPPPPAAPPPEPSSGGGANSPSSAPAAPAGTPTASLRIEDFRFVPASLSVRTGTSVQVLNAGRAPHTATAQGSFDTGMLRAGQTNSFIAARPGTFGFTCLVHPEMLGTLVVEGPPVSAVSSPAPPAGGGPSSPASPQVAPAAPLAGEVVITDFAFTPGQIEIARGGTITWTNDGLAPHTVTAEGFDSGMLDPGATFSSTFDSVGTFSYVCELHPQMRAAVRVVAGDGSPSARPSGGTSEGGGDEAKTASIATRSTPKTGVALAGAGVILAGTGALLFGSKKFLTAAD